MKSFYLSFLSVFFLLSGCSSSGGSSSDATAPVFTSSADVNVSENTTAVVTLTADDPSTPVTFTISGTDAGLFTLTGAALTFKTAPDFEAPGDVGANNVYNLVVTATDAASNSTVQTLTVRVTDVVEPDITAPVFTSSADVNVSENSTAVVTLTVDDASTVTFSISGTDAALFTLNDGNLTFTTAPNYEAPQDAGTDNVYNLVVTATDAASNSATQNLTVTVTDIAEDATVPVFTSSAAVSISENSTTVVTLAATDPSTPVTFAISGTDAGLFTLTGANLTFTTAPNFEAPLDAGANNVYNLVVTATDAASNSADQNLAVTVNDVADVVPTIEAFNTTVAEGTEAGRSIGTITILDTGDTAITSITLSGTGAADFNASADGNITVVNAPDYNATQPTYDLTAVATNTAGESASVPVTITIIPTAKVIASDPQADDNFGYSVAMSGNYVVVGAPFEDNGASDINNSGSAYVYLNDGNGNYSFVTKLNAANAAAGDNFGNSVAIDGDYVVIGAPGRANSTGAAYVFKNVAGTFSEVTELNATNSVAGDNFGHAVGISGNFVIAGAGPKDSARGSVYVFKNVADVFTQSQELTASDRAIDDYFGAALAIDGDFIVVGALLEDPAGTDNAGSAYVFKNNGTAFSQIAILNADDAEAGDHFAYSVAISGNFVVAGAYHEDPAGVADAGSAYVFEYDGASYTQVAKLNASDAQAGDAFGNTVGISGNYIIVGAELEDPFSFTDGQGGSAYIFENSAGTFSQITKLNAPDGKAGDHFGVSVGISGANAVVGAKIDDHSGASFAGSAYLFRYRP